jgi:hypothetical protein
VAVFSTGGKPGSQRRAGQNPATASHNQQKEKFPMSLLGKLIRGEAHERVEELKAKRQLEKRLGRKVQTHELYSLSAHFDAASRSGSSNDTPYLPPPPSAGINAPLTHPAGASRRRGVKLVILAAIAFVIMIGIAGLWTLNLPERTYNRLNPFTPKPPQGSFPAAIADYSLAEQPDYSSTYSSICKCNYFTASYKKAENSIYYKLYAFKTPEAARSYLKGRDFVGGSYKVVRDADTRTTWILSDGGDAIIALTAGSQLITLSSRKPADLIAFENSLPYSAYGAAQPPPRDAEELKEKPVAALTVLDDFNSDKAASQKKYHDQYFLFTGTVAGAGKTKKGIPFIAIEKPGVKSGVHTIVSCSFHTSQADKVSRLQVGDPVQFRGRVNLKSLLAMVVIEDCRLAGDQ